MTDSKKRDEPKLNVQSESVEEAKSLEQTLREEIKQLRAQVNELEAKMEKREELRAALSEADLDDFEDDERPRGVSGTRSRGTEPVGRRTARATRDASVRMMDETSKFMRGITIDFLEVLNMWAGMANTFTEEVLQRNLYEERTPRRRSFDDRSASRHHSEEDFSERGRDENREQRRDHFADSADRRDRVDDDDRSDRPRSGERVTVAGLAARLPLDIYAGCVRAIDESLNTPRRMVDNWYNAYRETEELKDVDDLDNNKERRRERAARRSERESVREARSTFDRATDEAAKAVEDVTRAAQDEVKK